jgi:YtkA-like
MRTSLSLVLVATALAVAGGASAGGWATAGVNQPPDGIAAGAVWKANVKVLQHGRTPLNGVKPTITIRNVETGKSQTFPAKPTGESGVYAADVVFPSGGTWRYEIYDGFGQYGGARTHTFAPVEVAGPAGDTGGSLTWTIGGSTVLALAIAALFVAGLRPRKRGALATASLR